MSHPMRFLVLGGVIVVLTGCSDTAPTAPALGGNAAVLAPKVVGQARGKPTRSPLPSSEPFEVPAGLVCSFGVFVETIVNNQVVKTFPPEPNGDIVQLATGAFVTRLTNTTTGKSITVNISGPGRFTIHPDGSATLEAWGRWNFFFIDAVNAGTKAIINSGRVVLSIAPDGTQTLVSQSGHEEDVCVLLS
jgi:hypothetical protein